MKPETKVGLLFIVSVAMVVVFGYYMGVLNPLSNSRDMYVGFNFAGGLEVGSPVRVMGVKVGKVKSVDFMPEMTVGGEEVKLRIKISVDKSAWASIRSDSQFYINLAGVIGEKFLEITPGSMGQEAIEAGSTVRGVDPPRIDQLISQSYGLAGKVLEFVETNEGSIIDTINTLNKLVVNFDQLLKQLESTSSKADLIKLLRNMTVLTDDLVFFTGEMRGKEGQKTLKLVNRLIWRLDELDAKAIKKFLQEDGIKAKLF